MSYWKNERGNAAFYLMGMLGFMGIIVLLLTNIGRAFVVGEHATNVAEQAAIAGSYVFIERTKEAIEEYDSWLVLEPDFLELGIEKVGDLVDEKKEEYESSGYSSNQAYVMALNSVLPSEINSRPVFRNYIRNRVDNTWTANQVYHAVMNIINQNEGNYEDTTVVLSETDWRLEVETTIKFGQVTDGSFIPSKEEKIESIGYGPKLTYLKDVFN